VDALKRRYILLNKQIKATQSAIPRVRREYIIVLSERSDFENVLKSVINKRVVSNKIIGITEVNKPVLKYPILTSNKEKNDAIYNNVEIDANVSVKKI